MVSVSWFNINLRGLIIANAILIEGQLRYYLFILTKSSAKWNANNKSISCNNTRYVKYASYLHDVCICEEDR